MRIELGTDRMAQIVQQITGAAPSAAPLLNYLEEKYAMMYDL